MATPDLGAYCRDQAGPTLGREQPSFRAAFDPNAYFPWLKKVEPYGDACLFVTVMGVVADLATTLRLYERWAPVWKAGCWPW